MQLFLQNGDVNSKNRGAQALRALDPSHKDRREH